LSQSDRKTASSLRPPPPPAFGWSALPRFAGEDAPTATSEQLTNELTKTIASRGGLAHLALFLWASGASGLLVWTLRELARANQRLEDFVKEIAALNKLFQRKD
jgi:hypothetical protein